MAWETVIGLEIHAQLATQSKIFSGASTAFGAEPNTQACAVDLGLPGVLPVVNSGVVSMAVKFALATEADITHRSVFARKNYFYPDLPKGYQISQMAFPIVGEGTITITLPDGQEKQVGLTRAHLEEDAGKSVHDLFEGSTGIDLNRAGTPLLEIVSEPDMRSAVEAVAYAKHIHSLVRYIDICDGNMQEGSFRCDANISIRPLGSDTLGTRTEVKNVNSFRFLERAIDFEVERQIDILESGGQIVQETRADYFEAVLDGQSFAPKLAANWMLGDLSGRMNKEDVDIADVPVSASQLSQLIQRIDDGTLSGKLGKQVFESLWAGEGEVDQIIEAKGLKQITDTGAIESMIDEVIAANPSQLAEYRAGKEKLLSFFVGSVMKASKGKANPAQLNQILREKLKG